MIRRGLEYVELNGWDRIKQQYFDLIDGLSTRKLRHLRSEAGSYSGRRTLT